MRRGWRQRFKYPDHVDAWAADVLDTLESLIGPMEESDWKFSDVMDWLNMGVKLGLLTTIEKGSLEYQVSPNF